MDRTMDGSMDGTMDGQATGRLVMYGAGNIGRGFIGQLFSNAGYDVVFVDVDEGIVDALNRERRYPVRTVSRDGECSTWVGPVRAVNGRDTEAVAAVIAEADYLATAVGAAILPRIAPVVAAGLMRRWASGNDAPLDLLLCENLMDVDRYMDGLLREALPASLHAQYGTKVGLVETSIGRMVPVMTPEQRAEHPLLVCVEPFDRLPVDAAAFRGPMPRIPSLEPVSPFRCQLETKLYLHNMGHCLTAYLGALRGCTHIHEAIATPEIRLFVQSAMLDAAMALARRHQTGLDALLLHAEDLIDRFGNPALGDTVLRVGRDPIRKLAPDDRMTGCARMCLEQGIVPSWLLFGMAAAFRFQPAGDASAAGLQAEMSAEGLCAVLAKRCGILPEERLSSVVCEADSIVGVDNALTAGIAWCEGLKRTWGGPDAGAA